VNVPQPESPTALQVVASNALEVSGVDPSQPPLDPALRPVEEMPRDEDGLVVLDLPKGVVYEGNIPSDLAMAPGALHHVRIEERQKWTNRLGLEIGAMMLASLAPFVLSALFLSEKEAATLMPLSSLVGGLLVVLVGLSAPRYTFGGLRRAKLRYFAEAVLVTAVAVLLASVWVAFVESAAPFAPDDAFSELRDLLGSAMLLAVMAVAPALFEELAFRGLLQGRLTALMGRFTGIIVTAALFALAHGISAGSPIHLGLGVYLGFLRDRSGSLLPGMAVHGFYNGSMVLLMS
jgi:membrane protease YdiL (CAAX protease family)